MAAFRSPGLLIPFVVALLAAGCSSTFTLRKDGGRSYFFGSRDEGLYRLLCESGDLRTILDDTSLQGEVKEALYKANCSPERSREQVKQIYASLAPEQREDLRTSFKNHGYDVNFMPC